MTLLTIVIIILIIIETCNLLLENANRKNKDESLEKYWDLMRAYRESVDLNCEYEYQRKQLVKQIEDSGKRGFRMTLDKKQEFIDRIDWIIDRPWARLQESVVLAQVLKEIIEALDE